MHRRYQSKHMIDILFVLVLFGLFTLSAIILIIFGANIYQTTVNNMDSNYHSRTSLSYITEKFRQADQNAEISIGSIQNIPALTFGETIDDVAYTTYIYEYDDKLYELFARKDLEMYPDGGQPIIDISSFSLEQTDSNLFHITIENTDHKIYSFYLCSHSAPN